jgi:4-hydroxy-4-methyl-2-oxoglutarate aldolase
MSLGFRVLERAPSPDPELARRLAEHDTADLSDLMQYSHTMVGVQAVWPFEGRVAGPAVTVSLPLGGIDVIKLAAGLCEPGDVLVLAARGQLGYAMWGGYLSDAMRARGLAAVVVDGAVRDVDDIAAARLPVLARGIATGAAPPSTPAEANVPVACAGVVVMPGDIVVADSKGVVVVPPALAGDVVAATASLETLHAGWDEDLANRAIPGAAEIPERARVAGCELPGG